MVYKAFPFTNYMRDEAFWQFQYMFTVINNKIYRLMSQEEKLRKESVLIRENEKSDFVYLVRSGKLAIMKSQKTEAVDRWQPCSRYPEE